MSKDKAEERLETNLPMKLRWKLMLGLGTILITLGLVIDWPPPESHLPDTHSFLVILGGLLGMAGLLAALRQE